MALWSVYHIWRLSQVCLKPSRDLVRQLTYSARGMNIPLTKQLLVVGQVAYA